MNKRINKKLIVIISVIVVLLCLCGFVGVTTHNLYTRYQYTLLRRTIIRQNGFRFQRDAFCCLSTYSGWEDEFMDINKINRPLLEWDLWSYERAQSGEQGLTYDDIIAFLNENIDENGFSTSLYTESDNQKINAYMHYLILNEAVRFRYREWLENTASEYVSQYIPGFELSDDEQTMNNINQLIKKYDDENFELHLDYKIAAQNHAFEGRWYGDKVHQGIPLDEINEDNLNYELKQYEEESGVKITYDEVIEALSAEVNEYGESIVELDNNEKLWNYVLWYFAKDL